GEGGGGQPGRPRLQGAGGGREAVAGVGRTGDGRTDRGRADGQRRAGRTDPPVARPARSRRDRCRTAAAPAGRRGAGADWQPVGEGGAGETGHRGGSLGRHPRGEGGVETTEGPRAVSGATFFRAVRITSEVFRPTSVRRPSPVTPTPP